MKFNKETAIKIAAVFGIAVVSVPLLKEAATVHDTTGQVCRVESDGAAIIDPKENYYGREFATMEVTEMGPDGPVKGDAIFSAENPMSQNVKGGFIVNKDTCTVITDGKNDPLWGLIATRFEFKREP